MIVALLLILTSPFTTHITKVDVIELNHVQNSCGCTSFSQFIFWGPYPSGIHVIAYKMTNDWRVLQQGDRTSVIWHDGEVFRQVSSRCFKETWTHFDAERLDRIELPESERKGL